VELGEKRVTDGVTRLMVQDKRTVLFESLWETKGVIYNSYLVETTEGFVLVDTVPHEASEQFLELIESLVKENELKHLIVNHMEPDHSGAMGTLLERFPKIQVLISAPGFGIFRPRNGKPVTNGQELTLGDRTFVFHHVPWVHWPETMFTELKEEKVLFTGDVLVSFGIHSSPEGRDYFFDVVKSTACVLMGYRNFFELAMGKIKELNPRIVAPAHGPVSPRDKLDGVLEALETALTKPQGKIVVFSSMYGRSKKIAKEPLQRGERGGASPPPRFGVDPPGLSNRRGSAPFETLDIHLSAPGRRPDPLRDQPADRLSGPAGIRTRGLPHAKRALYR
jgi:flavorubredoxin